MNRRGTQPGFNRDPYGRTVNYLRLSVTDRCNLRCRYCMPAGGVKLCPPSEILSFEDLLRIAETAVGLGIEKIRITGGEPLVRKGLIGFLKELRAIPGLGEVTLTTNGTRLADTASDLRAAGIGRLNVSLDSLDPVTYASMTRGGRLSSVLDGLEKAEGAGLRLKLNMVVMRGINDREVRDFAGLTLDRCWSVRFIEYMPTIREPGWRNRIVAGSEVLDRLAQYFDLEPLPPGPLCGPAKPYRIRGAAGTIGIIAPISERFCGDCNRIRVTARGLARSCLLSEQVLDLKPFLGRDSVVLEGALTDVIHGKKNRHDFQDQKGTVHMSCVGG